MSGLLNQIALLKGTDKSSEIHNYCEKYQKYLPFYRSDKIKIMEIGVLNGESLMMWRDYFYNAKIVGIDINPDCKKFEDLDRNIHIEIGSQYDEEFLKQVSDKHGPFDMILDDGSHINKHVIFSFQKLFDSVVNQGVYIVEDVCTSYWDSYEGGRYKEGSMMEYFKGVTDEVNFFGEWQESHPNLLARREDLLIEQFKRKGYDYIGTQIESINFLNGIIIITKR